MNANKIDILIVDDQADIRMHLREILQDEGYQTREAHHSESALAALQNKTPDLVLLDIWLEGSPIDGLEILKKIMEKNTDIPVLMISGHGNIETAVQAIKIGAYDFVEKPFKTDHLLHLCARALETSKLRKENRELKEERNAPCNLIGHSQPIQAISQIIERVAPTNSRVMIMGEQGTGKSVIANLIHHASKRNKSPFISINCALLEGESLEEELFGREDNKGTVLIEGLLEKAQGGTLFLDDVSDLSLEVQAKLLKILQKENFKRLNGTKEIKMDARILSSCHRHIEKSMKEGWFREDLFYRLNVVPLLMPALRERRDDIEILSQEFMNEIAYEYGKVPLVLSPEVLLSFQTYEWPGNIRQLRNVIEHLLIMTPSQQRRIEIKDLPPEISHQSEIASSGSQSNVVEIMSLPLRQARKVFEKNYLVSQVNRFNGNISKTAHFIGMERSALHRKMKTLGINETSETKDSQDQGSANDEIIKEERELAKTTQNIQQ